MHLSSAYFADPASPNPNLPILQPNLIQAQLISRRPPLAELITRGLLTTFILSCKASFFWITTGRSLKTRLEPFDFISLAHDARLWLLQKRVEGLWDSPELKDYRFPPGRKGMDWGSH